MPSNFRVVLVKVNIGCGKPSSVAQCTIVSMPICQIDSRCPLESMAVDATDTCAPDTNCGAPTCIDPIGTASTELTHASAKELKALHDELSKLLGAVHGHLKTKDPSSP